MTKQKIPSLPVGTKVVVLGEGNEVFTVINGGPKGKVALCNNKGESHGCESFEKLTVIPEKPKLIPRGTFIPDRLRVALEAWHIWFKIELDKPNPDLSTCEMELLEALDAFQQTREEKLKAYDHGEGVDW